MPFGNQRFENTIHYFAYIVEVVFLLTITRHIIYKTRSCLTIFLHAEQNYQPLACAAFFKHRDTKENPLKKHNFIPYLTRKIYFFPVSRHVVTFE